MATFVHVFVLCAVLSVRKSLQVSDSRTKTVVFQDCDFRDKIVYEDIVERAANVLSPIACSLVCTRTVNCISFFHSEETFLCQLHSRLFVNTSNAIFESGSTYHILFPPDIISVKSFNKLKIMCGWRRDFSFFQNVDGGVSLCIRHSLDDRLTHDEARNICSRDGARLIQLETEEKNNFFRELLLTKLDIGSVWIGGSLVNSTWVWNTDANDPINYFNWGASSSQEPDGSGNCIRLSSSDHFTWSDTRCSQRKKFVCEISLT